jgi:hypothetical protein
MLRVSLKTVHHKPNGSIIWQPGTKVPMTFIPSLIALPPYELIWYCAIYAVSSLHELNPYEFLNDPCVKSCGHKWNIYGFSFPHGQIGCEF